MKECLRLIFSSPTHGNRELGEVSGVRAAAARARTVLRKYGTGTVYRENNSPGGTKYLWCVYGSDAAVHAE